MFVEGWGENVGATVKHTGICIPGQMSETLAPSSQTLRKLSMDMMRYWEAFDSELTDLPANNKKLASSVVTAYETSLDITIERRGSALRLSTNCFRGNISVISVGEDKSVRCYTSPPLHDPLRLFPV